MKAVTKKQVTGNHETYWHYFDWRNKYLGHVRKIKDDDFTTNPYQVFVIDRDKIRVVDEAHPVSFGMSLPMESFWADQSNPQSEILAQKAAEAHLLEYHINEEIMILSVS